MCPGFGYSLDHTLILNDDNVQRAATDAGVRYLLICRQFWRQLRRREPPSRLDLRWTRSLERSSDALPASSPLHLYQRYRYVFLPLPLYTKDAIKRKSDLAQWGFMAGVAEATIPAIYHQSFGTVDPTNSGETSVNSLSRVLSTSLLPAATVDKVCLSPSHGSSFIL